MCDKNDTEKTNLKVDLWVKEYEKLKDEQSHRIGFRDNILYVLIVSVGATLFFVAEKDQRQLAILLIPWICLILGWTYLINDEKISAIGNYIKDQLSKRIIEGLKTDISVFGWEYEHRIVRHRMRRKIFQLLIDEVAFCFVGIYAVVLYLYIEHTSINLKIVAVIEILLLIWLGIEIFICSDFNKTNKNTS